MTPLTEEDFVRMLDETEEWCRDTFGHSANETDDIVRIVTELREARARLAAVIEVIGDHDDCTCEVRHVGCEYMWNELREVFRAAATEDTK